jgi:hypothetical protein
MDNGQLVVDNGQLIIRKVMSDKRFRGGSHSAVLVAIENGQLKMR